MNVDSIKLRKWETPFYSIRYLGNVRLRLISMGTLVAQIENLEEEERFRVTFNGMLGVRFEDAFNEERMINSFVAEDSPWVADMLKKPFRTRDISTASHYVIFSKDGRLDVVSTEDPKIEKDRPTIG